MIQDIIQSIRKKSPRYQLKQICKLYKKICEDYSALYDELEETKKRLKAAEEQVPKYNPVVIPCGEIKPQEKVNMDDTKGIVKCGKCLYYDLDEMYCHFHGEYVLAKINGVCCNVYFEKE